MLVLLSLFITDDARDDKVFEIGLGSTIFWSTLSLLISCKTAKDSTIGWCGWYSLSDVSISIVTGVGVSIGVCILVLDDKCTIVSTSVEVTGFFIKHDWNTGLFVIIRTWRNIISNWKLLWVNFIPCISNTDIISLSGFTSSIVNCFSFSSNTKHVGIFKRFFDGAIFARNE